MISPNHMISMALAWMAIAGSVVAQPVIVTQPADQTNDLGGTVTFRVVADGAAPLRYQWRDYAGSSQFIAISGATNEALIFENVQATTHRFAVVVSNDTGSVMSRLARLAVLGPPSIATHPMSQTATQGGSATFRVTLAPTTATPVTYQWRNGGVDRVGSTASNLVVSGLELSHVGEYSVMISNRLGSITSSVAGLSLKTLIRPPFSPGLSVTPSGAQVRLTWQGEGELQQSFAPTGPWGSLTSTGESWIVHTTNPAAFYRLRNPRSRAVDVVVPSSYKPGSRLPLVIALHGYGGSGPSFNSAIPFQSMAAERGFLYSYPSATLNTAAQPYWNATDACCNFYGGRVDDAAFLRSLVDEMDRTFGVDRKRVHLFGYSNGGFMSFRMACAHSDLIASIASFAGATFKTSGDCQPAGPVSVLQIHGTADPVVFYAGGILCTCVTGVTSTTPPAPGALETIQHWAAYNGCVDPVTTASAVLDLTSLVPGNDTVVTEYRTHPPGGEVELWSIQGADHGLSFSAQGWARIVDWLLAHPKP